MKYDLSKKLIIKIWCVVLFQIKIWHVLHFLIQNLTRCTFFRSKCDHTKQFHFKIWRVVKFLIRNLTHGILFVSKPDAMTFVSVQNLTCCELLISNSDQTKNVSFKIWCVVKLLFQNLIRCVAWVQNLTRCIFCIQNLTCRKIVIRNLTHCLFYIQNLTLQNVHQFQIWRVVKLLTQNLTNFFQNPTRCFLFRSKTDMW